MAEGTETWPVTMAAGQAAPTANLQETRASENFSLRPAVIQELYGPPPSSYFARPVVVANGVGISLPPRSNPFVVPRSSSATFYRQGEGESDILPEDNRIVTPRRRMMFTRNSAAGPGDYHSTPQQLLARSQAIQRATGQRYSVHDQALRAPIQSSGERNLGNSTTMPQTTHDNQTQLQNHQQIPYASVSNRVLYDHRTSQFPQQHSFMTLLPGMNLLHQTLTTHSQAMNPVNFNLSNSGNTSSSVHPSFRSKAVCKLTCKFCITQICKRGMKAILLADTRVELYSTDTVPPGRVQLVADDYLTRNCHCRIRDVACLGWFVLHYNFFLASSKENSLFNFVKTSGNVIGYHVTQPCDVCMAACNNGHFWMFHDDSVNAFERMDGSKVLLWSQIPYFDRDDEGDDERILR